MFLMYAQPVIHQEIVSEQTVKPENSEGLIKSMTIPNALLFEDFESLSPGVLPSGWKKIHYTGTAWNTGKIGTGTVNILGHSGYQYAYVTTSQSDKNDTWLFTKALPFVEGKSYKINFWTYLVRRADGTCEKLEVKIGTSADTIGMTERLYHKEDVYQSTWTEENLVYTPETTGNYYIGFHVYSGRANATMLDDVIVYEVFKNDVGVAQLNLKSWIPDTNNYTISGKIRNYGLDTITSCKINYRINNGTVYTHDLSDFNLIPDNELDFIFPETVVPVIGKHTITVWTSEPNGKTDSNPLNDDFIFQYKVFDTKNSFPLCPLLEGFTSSTCGSCPTPNTYLKNLLASNKRPYVLIKYQDAGPGVGDPYYTMEAGVKYSFYQIPGPPYLAVNGTQKMNTDLITNTILQTLQDTYTSIKMDAEYTIEGQKVKAKVTIDPRESLQVNNLRLFMAIVEKRTTNNKKTNGETEFIQVMKKFMPDADGISIGALTAGTLVVQEQEWEFQGKYRLPANGQSANIINHNIEHSVENFCNLEVVVWLQNMQTKEIYQSATARLLGCETAIQDYIKKHTDISPNPATDIVIVENAIGATIEIFDVLGHLLIKKQTNNERETININELSRGFYFVKIQKDKEQKTYKLIKE